MNDINYENACVLIRPMDMLIELVSPKDAIVTLEEMYEWLQCEMIEVVQIGRNAFLVIDEEGRVRFDEGQNPNGYFSFGGFPEVLCGRGLVVGIKNGEMVGTHLAIRDVAPLIHWAHPAR